MTTRSTLHPTLGTAVLLHWVQMQENDVTAKLHTPFSCAWAPGAGSQHLILWDVLSLRCWACSAALDVVVPAQECLHLQRELPLLPSQPSNTLTSAVTAPGTAPKSQACLPMSSCYSVTAHNASNATQASFCVCTAGEKPFTHHQ